MCPSIQHTCVFLKLLLPDLYFLNWLLVPDSIQITNVWQCMRCIMVPVMFCSGSFLLLSLVSHSLFFFLQSSCWAIFLCIAWSLKRVYLKSPRKVASCSLELCNWGERGTGSSSFSPKEKVSDFLYCVWFKEHLKLHTSILVAWQSSLRNGIHGVYGALVSHVTTLVCRRRDGHWRLEAVLLISVASSLPSVNDRGWPCAT